MRMQVNSWSEKEDAIIFKMAEYYPVELICKRLRHLGYCRTVYAVKKRASLLEISLRPTLNYISPFRTAPLLNVHPSTVYRWVRQGLLVALCRPGGHFAIRIEDVQELIKNPPNKTIKRVVLKIPEENKKYIFDDYA